MCGIAGIFHRNGRPASPSVVATMSGRLYHRGPDDSGLWCDGPIGLGHRRLSIRDLSSAGRQPTADPDGNVYVSYNGEIYNDCALRSELTRTHGITFRTTCDTEIIPAGYLAWGDAVFDRLEGMFAIALWDRRAKRLILVRDGVGIKPLYYHADNDTVRFASEIKALLADPDQSSTLSADGVHRFLAMGYSGPTTSTFETIRQVPPGTFLSFDSDKETSHTFWRPTRNPDITNLDDAVDEFLARWPTVVSDQLISDVPVGILQSGGIDSSLVSVAANATDSSGACRGTSPTPLFTASFSQRSFDESSLAEELASHLGAPFHRVPVTEPKQLAEVVRACVWHYDGQIADEASLSLYLLSAAVRKHVTVALTGDGGDEFFGGYPTYAASRAADTLGRFAPRALWEAAGRIGYRQGAGNDTRLPLSAKLRRLALGIADGGPGNAHAYWRRLFPQFIAREAYGSRLQGALANDPFAAYAELLDSDADVLSLIDRCLLADQSYHLPGGLLLKSDIMTMAHSLEVRVPLLDRRIMDLAGRIDHTVLMGPLGETKRVLRAAAERLKAPASIVTGTKRGFNTPLSRLLRTDLSQLAESCFNTEVDRVEGWLSADAVRRLWQEHKDCKVNHDYTLWPILNLSLALDTVGHDAPASAKGAHSKARMAAPRSNTSPTALVSQ